MTILIAYESKHGSTREIAYFIKKMLIKYGHGVTVRHISDINNLENYHAVIIGSPIQYDRWMPFARKFIKENSEILGKIPAAFFFSSLTLAVKSKKSEKNANSYAEKLCSLAPDIKPLSIGCFAGVLDYSKYSFLFRLISKIVFAIIGLKEGDYRDWDAVEKWTEEINLKLSAVKTQFSPVGF